MPAGSTTNNDQGSKTNRLGSRREIGRSTDGNESKKSESADSGTAYTKSHNVLPFINVFMRKNRGPRNQANYRDAVKDSLQQDDGDTRSLGSANSKIYSAKIQNNEIDANSPSTNYSNLSPPADETENAIKLVKELERLNLQPIALERFIKYFHKFAVASGVSPENLVILIRKIVELSEGTDKGFIHDSEAKISIADLHSIIQDLGKKQEHLLDEVEKLELKKDSLEVEIRLKELDYSTIKESVAEFNKMKDELSRYDLSIEQDLSKLVELVRICKEKLGHDFSSISHLLSDLQSIHEKKAMNELETAALLDSKKELEDNLEITKRAILENRQIIFSVNELKKIGLDVKELENLHASIKRISENEKVDMSSASQILLSDLEAYNRNSGELKNNLRVLESLLERKSMQFASLELDYGREKDLLDKIKRIKSSNGFSEEWIEKIKEILDSYEMDLDSFIQGIKQQKTLKNNIDSLQNQKQELQQEQLSLQHKLIASEEQRLKLENELATLRLKLDSARNLAQIISSEKSAENHIDALADLLDAASNGDNIDAEKFRSVVQQTIGSICKMMSPRSTTKIALEHALLAIKYELPNQKETQDKGT